MPLLDASHDRLSLPARRLAARMIRRGVFDAQVRERASQLIVDAAAVPARRTMLFVEHERAGDEHRIRRQRDGALLALVPDGPEAGETARFLARVLEETEYAGTP